MKLLDVWAVMITDLMCTGILLIIETQVAKISNMFSKFFFFWTNKLEHDFLTTLCSLL